MTAVDATAPVAPVRTRSTAEQRMCRLLCLTDTTPTATEESARRLVEKSLFISMVRCLLTYIVLPFVAPAIGVASGVGPVLGLVIGLVAIVANVASVRRFWRADHRYRWHYTALSAVIVAALAWLVVADVVDLLG
ncbi:MAG: hypothetical protein ACSLFP_09540 [Acidimicrobiales bacterium]